MQVIVALAGGRRQGLASYVNYGRVLVSSVARGLDGTAQKLSKCDPFVSMLAARLRNWSAEWLQKGWRLIENLH
jgi:hypothetical protein